MGHAVQKVCRAIQWVNNPATCRIGPFGKAAFFAQPAIGRTRFCQFCADDLFGLDIGLGYKITRTFGANLQVLDFAEIF